MIRPDFSLFDQQARRSPVSGPSPLHLAKLAAAAPPTPAPLPHPRHRHRRSVSGSALGGAVKSLVQAWGENSNNHNYNHGSFPISSSSSTSSSSSASCPRTPSSLKKRKDTSSVSHLIGQNGMGAPPHSAAYRRELERKLLDGDYLIFHYEPAGGSAHHHQLDEKDSSSTARTPISPPPQPVPPVPSFAPGSISTIGSLTGVSSLLLSGSTSAHRDFLFTPQLSVHPSPALQPIKPPMHALAQAALNFPPLPPTHNAHPHSHTSTPLGPNKLPPMSIDVAATWEGGGHTPPRSPTPERSPMGGLMNRKFFFTAAQVADVTPAPSPVQGAIGAALAAASASPSSSSSSALFSPPTPHRPRVISHRRGNSSLGGAMGGGGHGGMSFNGWGSSGNESATINNHNHTHNMSMSSPWGESQRGSSFSSSLNSSHALSALLSPDPASVFGSPRLSPTPSPPSFPFSLHTRRRNNSGPPSVVRDRSSTPVNRNLPEPGAPVAAFNVFGSRIVPQHAQQLNQGDEAEFAITTTPLLHPATPPLPPSTPAPLLPPALPPPILSATHFTFERKIGRGSFGEVWSVRRILSPSSSPSSLPSSHRLLGPRVAIKKQLAPLTRMAERRAMLRRAELLKQLVDTYNKKGAQGTSQQGSAVHTPLLLSRPSSSLSHRSPSRPSSGPSSFSLKLEEVAVETDTSIPTVGAHYFLTHSPVVSPRLKPIEAPAHQPGQTSALLSPSAAASPPSSSSSTTSSSTSSSSAASYRWPPHLLRHHNMWHESATVYTETEHCALGDLFDFFGCRERDWQRRVKQREAEEAEAAAADSEEDNASSRSSDSDDDSDEDAMEHEFHPRQRAHSLQLGRTASALSLMALEGRDSDGSAPLSALSDMEEEELEEEDLPPETKSLTEEDLWQLLYQVSLILSILHDQNLLHNDLKPENVYCQRRGELDADAVEWETMLPSVMNPPQPYPYIYKLGDLGSLVSLSEWSAGSSEEGDGSYLAPEVLNPAIIAHGPPATPTPSPAYGAMGSSAPPSHVHIHSPTRTAASPSPISWGGPLPAIPVSPSPSSSPMGGFPSSSSSSRAAPAHISPKVDIYALGASLYTLITGAKFSSSVLAAQESFGLDLSNASMQHLMQPSPTRCVRHKPDPELVSTPLAAGASVHANGAGEGVLEWETQAQLLSPPRPSSLTSSVSHDSLSSFTLTSFASPSTPQGRGRSLALTPLSPQSTTPVSPVPESSDASPPFLFPLAASPVPFSSPLPAFSADNQVEFDPLTDLVAISHDLAAMIRRMLSMQPAIRPSAQELREWAKKGIQAAAERGHF